MSYAHETIAKLEELSDLGWVDAEEIAEQLKDALKVFVEMPRSKIASQEWSEAENALQAFLLKARRYLSEQVDSKATVTDEPECPYCGHHLFFSGDVSNVRDYEGEWTLYECKECEHTCWITARVQVTWDTRRIRE